MFCRLQAPANHSHLRNWDARPRDAQPFAPRAMLMIEVTAWLLIRDHQANFSPFSTIFFFLFVFLRVPEWEWCLSALVFQSPFIWGLVTDLYLQALCPRDLCTWHRLHDVLQYFHYFHLSGKDKSFKVCKLVSSCELISSELRTTSTANVVSAGPFDTAPSHLARVLGYDQSSLNSW